MRISFSTGSFYHRGVGYSLRLARELGYDGVELALGWDFMLGGVPAVERALRRESGAVLSIHPPFLPLPGWPQTVPTRLERLVTAVARSRRGHPRAAHALPLGRGFAARAVATPACSNGRAPRPATTCASAWRTASIATAANASCSTISPRWRASPRSAAVASPTIRATSAPTGKTCFAATRSCAPCSPTSTSAT